MTLTPLFAIKTPLQAPDPGNEIIMSIAQSAMTQWCWAAATVGIAALYQDTGEPLQCQVAYRVFNQAFQCCQTNESCNEQRPFSIALNTHFADFETDLNKRTLAFVKEQICKHTRPVPIFMVSGRDGHILVISKYWIDQQGVEWFGIWDPELPTDTNPKPVSREQLVTDYRGRTWFYSHLTQ
jgi:hypothetical protein